MAVVFGGIFRDMIPGLKTPCYSYNVAANNRILSRIPSPNQPFSSFHARKLPYQKMQVVLRSWKTITTTLKRFNLYGTVNYESRIVKIYEKISGNPHFPRAGHFLDAIIFGFTIEDALILLTIEDIYSETIKLKASHVELALWLEILQQKQRQLQRS